ncbi:MAG: hypothetical protein PHU63_04025 [Candidatus ainarchaeum sp.]|nr:hypothetical protein [Candidatus ainarchaeum sp.]
MKIISIFLIILLISNSFSLCSGTTDGYVPAVSGSKGIIIPIKISLTEGSGKNYISTYPFVGITTQESINTAAIAAYYLSNIERKNCDIILEFSEDYAEQVDGPSAGAATSVILYGLINNLTFKENTLITGGINSKGTIVPVGGIYEKSLAATKNDFQYILLPKLSVKEKILLSTLKEDYPITILEFNTLEEMVNFVFYNSTVKENLFFFQNESKTNISVYPFFDSDLEDFIPVTDYMISIQGNSINSLTDPEGFEGLPEYYHSMLNNTIELRNKGYLFTAANRAFLDYIDISTISGINDLDIEDKKNKVLSCLNSLPSVEKTKDNFQWVISSELREYWARDKIDTLILYDDMLVEEKYFAFNELSYADAWCHVASALREVAIEKSIGQKIDESIWKDYAQKTLDEVSIVQNQKGHLEEDYHIKTAVILFNNGKYGASIYDSLYYLELESKDDFFIDENSIDTLLENYSQTFPSSVWGKIYHTQAYYLHKKENPNKFSALDIYRYADSLDKANDGMILLIPEEEEKFPCVPSFILLFSLFLSLIFKNSI